MQKFIEKVQNATQYKKKKKKKSKNQTYTASSQNGMVYPSNPYNCLFVFSPKYGQLYEWSNLSVELKCIAVVSMDGLPDFAIWPLCFSWA